MSISCTPSWCLQFYKVLTEIPVFRQRKTAREGMNETERDIPFIAGCSINTLLFIPAVPDSISIQIPASPLHLNNKPMVADNPLRALHPRQSQTDLRIPSRRLQSIAEHHWSSGDNTVYRLFVKRTGRGLGSYSSAAVIQAIRKLSNHMVLCPCNVFLLFPRLSYLLLLFTHSTCIFQRFDAFFSSIHSSFHYSHTAFWYHEPGINSNVLKALMDCQ